MTRREDLLRAIRDEPDEDAPRLVYADWLEEQGGPEEADRAEFIRVQVERARLPEYDLRRHELRLREQALLREHRNTWGREAPAWAYNCGLFQRGFIAEVLATVHEFLRGAPGLFRRVPLQGTILRTQTADALTALADSPHLARLTSVTLADNCAITIPALQALCASPHLGKLRQLSLHLHDTGPEAAETVASAPHLGGLTHLAINGWGRIGDAGAEALAASPHLAGLRVLRLNNNSITGAGARALLTSPHLSRLTRLALTVNQIDPAGAATLAAALPRRRLIDLDLSRNRRLGDAGVAALADSPGLADLTGLRLIDCGIGPGGVRALAQSAHLGELKCLELGGNNAGDAGVATLAASPGLPQLTLLNLRGCRVSAAALDALAGSPRLPQLAFVLVSAADISRATWDALKKRFGRKLLSDREAWDIYLATAAVGVSTLVLDSLSDMPL
jgi:uncharacterized protein (TIGR02996 family)